jgi:hypothetical protein
LEIVKFSVSTFSRLHDSYKYNGSSKLCGKLNIIFASGMDMDGKFV